MTWSMVTDWRSSATGMCTRGCFSRASGTGKATWSGRRGLPTWVTGGITRWTETGLSTGRPTAGGRRGTCWITIGMGRGSSSGQTGRRRRAVSRWIKDKGRGCCWVRTGLGRQVLGRMIRNMGMVLCRSTGLRFKMGFSLKTSKLVTVSLKV